MGKTPLTDIGECLVSVGEYDFFFRPSFLAMTRIGSPTEIVQAFYDLHNDEATQLMQRAVEAYGRVPAWILEHIGQPQFSKRAVEVAATVLQACCDEDVAPLTGELKPGKTGRRGFVWRRGEMSIEMMIWVAQSLISHGVIGKARVRKLQRHESTETSREFNAVEYINAARTHFGIGRQEAESLTMTEFILLLNAKYPDQKGFTREEYDAVADDYLRRKQERLQKQMQK